MIPRTSAAQQHLSTAWLVAIVVVGLAAATRTSAQTASLIRDINTTSGQGADGFHQVVTPGLVECGAFLYFVGESKSTGKEMWRTDGTEAGTELVVEIYRGEDQGPNPQYFACANSTFFFARTEIYITDGTATGTSMLKDINPGSSASYPKSLTGIGGLLYFQANDGTNGEEPWVTDGTDVGTVMLMDIYPGVGSSMAGGTTFFGFDGYVYFSADSGGFGRELWRTDGTPGGTLPFKWIGLTGSGSYPSQYTDGGSVFFFTADDGVSGREVWVSDGTDLGTVTLKDINPTGSSYPGDLTMMGGMLYFSAEDGVNGVELWQSDGTEAGTVMVKDINPTGFSFPMELQAVGNVLYFSADDGVHGHELWRSDGTEAGTVIVADINPTGGSDPREFTAIGSTVYFLADDSTSGHELWQTDGTEAGTVRVADIASGSDSSEITYLTAWNGALFFGATDLTHGHELWTSDGTEIGTEMLKNVHSDVGDSEPWSPLVSGALLYFTADDYWGGRELWKSNGTPSGTARVKDIRLGFSSSDPLPLADFNGILLFRANASFQGLELWKSNGTSAGTELVKDIRPGSYSSSPSSVAVLASEAIFSADDGTNGRELWKTDGTSDNTVLVKDINDGSSGSDATHMKTVGDVVVFRADDGIHGTEVWVTDGTFEGTELLADIVPGPTSSSPYSFTFSDGLVFFTADDGTNGRELWRSDGTAAGTFMVMDINVGSGASSISMIAGLGGFFYFSANDGTHGSELWRTEGTEIGTSMVKDIWAGPDSSYPSLVGMVDGAMVLTVHDGTLGRALWVTDGTEAGTTFLYEILPGEDSYNTYRLGSIDGSAYFSAFLPETGLEIWSTDGTPEGTDLVADVRPGAEGSFTYTTSNRGAVLGDQLIFSAVHNSYGRELWGLCAGVFYEDSDNDGSGNPNVTTFACSAPVGYVDNSNDCDDGEGTVFPGAVELCDVLDNDCDGRADEPEFAGLASAVLLPSAGCEVQLSWVAAGPAPCGGAVTYSVYRTMEDDFIPSAANRIASGLTGLTYTDAGAISPNGTYHYAVRATAATTDSEDSNLVRLSVSLSGSGCTPSGPSPVAFFTARASDGEVLLEWLNPEFPYSHTQLCWSDSVYPASPFCDPWVHSSFGTPGDSDSAVPYAGVYNDTDYYFTSWIYYNFPGITGFSVPVHCRARPYSGSPEIPWVFSTGASSLAPTGIRPGDSVFTVSNDRSLHSVDAGVTGGRWSNDWKPVAMNGPAQARPAPVPFSTTTIGGATEVIFVSSEDGHVYAFDTVSGRELWRSPKLGDTVIAATSGILTDFGGSQDVILVGSRTPTGDSKFYGLMLQTGAVDWVFDNGGGTSGVGIISGQAQVSYATNRVYFTSRRKAGGSSNTLWCLELVGTPDEVQLAWARDLGDIDGSPILRDGVLYVGNNEGHVFALDPFDGTDAALPYTPTVPDGAVKGFVWVDTTVTPTRLYYSTTSSVHALVDDGVSTTQLWPAVSIASPSPLIIVGDGIWFGSTAENGSLRRINKHTGTETNRILLGDSGVPKTVGAPTYDIQPSVITVGTDEGRIYAVEIPSP